MSDAHLRELERAWQQSGSVEDEARWIAARQQSGLVSRERLGLAARLGHEAAALAAGTEVCPATRLPGAVRRGRQGLPSRKELWRWLHGFDGFGAIARRCAVALITRHVERLTDQPALRPARACWEAAILHSRSGCGAAPHPRRWGSVRALEADLGRGGREVLS